MSNRSELLCALQQYDFVLYELQLYLNSHPECAEALKKYRKCKAMKQAAEEQYVQLCGPVRAEQSDTENRWNWTDDPWPWEKEANC